jgi:hypothetical protein
MLKYNGNGVYPGVPTRDLTDDEVEEYGGEEFLLSLHPAIYEKVEKPVKKPVMEANDGRDSST